jgi:hypothetical protein
MFPCFDEPCLKATFELRVRVRLPSGSSYGADTWQVLSNMPLAKPRRVGRKNAATLKYRFAVTPVMSTYLLALVIAPLVPSVNVNVTASVMPSIVTVWTYPGDERFGDHPRRFATAVLRDLATLFDVPYPLPKLDLVPVFDFDAGAMENWGLVTFRPSMLYADADTPVAILRDVHVTIAHELAHQWFGNLVTMAWWDDLWLNESFATFAATWTCARLYGTNGTNGADGAFGGFGGFTATDAWVAFLVSEMSEALELDALPSTRSIVPDAASVTSVRDIEGLFDARAYAKGAVVLRMAACVLGLDNFARGLSTYLRQHAYGNACAGDLWAALASAAPTDLDVDIGRFLTPWLHTRGFPIVTVDADGVVAQTPFHDDDKGVGAMVWPLAVRRAVVVDPGLYTHPSVCAVLSQSIARSAPSLLDARFQTVMANDTTDRIYTPWYFNMGLVTPCIHGSTTSLSQPLPCNDDDVLAVSATQLAKLLSLRIRVQHGLDPPSVDAVTFMQTVSDDMRVHRDVRAVAADMLDEWALICSSFRTDCNLVNEGPYGQPQPFPRVTKRLVDTHTSGHGAVPSMGSSTAASIADADADSVSKTTSVTALKAAALDDTLAPHKHLYALQTLGGLAGASVIRDVLDWASNAVRQTDFMYLFVQDRTETSESSDTSALSDVPDARDKWLMENWSSVTRRQGKHGMEQIVGAVLQHVRTPKVLATWQAFFSADGPGIAEADVVEEALHDAVARVRLSQAVRTHVCACGGSLRAVDNSVTPA